MKSLSNLANDHWFIFIGSKIMKTYAQNGQYHTTTESRIHLTNIN